MEQTKEAASGQFIPYPCPSCGHHYRLVDQLIGQKREELATLECKTCDSKQQLTVGEVKQIIAYQSTFE